MDLGNFAKFAMLDGRFEKVYSNTDLSIVIFHQLMLLFVENKHVNQTFIMNFLQNNLKTEENNQKFFDQIQDFLNNSRMNQSVCLTDKIVFILQQAFIALKIKSAITGNDHENIEKIVNAFMVTLVYFKNIANTNGYEKFVYSYGNPVVIVAFDAPVFYSISSVHIHSVCENPDYWPCKWSNNFSAEKIKNFKKFAKKLIKFRNFTSQTFYKILNVYKYCPWLEDVFIDYIKKYVQVTRLSIYDSEPVVIDDSKDCKYCKKKVIQRENTKICINCCIKNKELHKLVVLNCDICKRGLNTLNFLYENDNLYHLDCINLIN